MDEHSPVGTHASTLNKFHRQAAALARKAIELDPARPKAYAMLGFALRSEGAARAARSESFADEYRGAARALVQYMQVATQRGERESFGFAPCASMAFELLVRPECADEPFGGEPSYYDWLCSQYRRKATALAAALETAGLPVVPSEGGYFLTVDVADVDVPQRYLEETSDAIDTVTKDWAFCRWLAIEHGVLSIPVAPFFSAKRRASGEAGSYVRFAFCKTDETLEKVSLRQAPGHICVL